MKAFSTLKEEADSGEERDEESERGRKKRERVNKTSFPRRRHHHSVSSTPTAEGGRKLLRLSLFLDVLHRKSKHRQGKGREGGRG